MKKLSLVLAGVILVSGITFAQDKTTKTDKKTTKTEKTTKTTKTTKKMDKKADTKKADKK